LQVTTDLSPFALWLTLTNEIQTTGMMFNLTLPLAPDSSRFYRLQPSGSPP
jgi:hypothetical protein